MSLQDLREQYPGFFYHNVGDPELTTLMIDLRRGFQLVGADVLEHAPHTRERSLAMTYLQIALMFTIAALAIEGGDMQS